MTILESTVDVIEQTWYCYHRIDLKGNGLVECVMTIKLDTMTRFKFYYK